MAWSRPTRRQQEIEILQKERKSELIRNMKTNYFNDPDFNCESSFFFFFLSPAELKRMHK